MMECNCNKMCKLECIKGYEKDKKILEELERRIKITYKVRINSTNRLRDKYNEYKKLNIYYSALVTGLSIVTIGIEGKIGKLSISNIVLMCSIVLTYFMFYTSEQNLQERAYRMEETFKCLDKLRNKINILLGEKQADITEETCKKLYKEYEAILASIENHEEIDYDMYKLYDFKKNGFKEEQEDEYLDVEKRVNQFKSWNKWKLRVKYIAPIIGIIILVLKL